MDVWGDGCNLWGMPRDVITTNNFKYSQGDVIFKPSEKKDLEQEVNMAFKKLRIPRVFDKTVVDTQYIKLTCGKLPMNTNAGEPKIFWWDIQEAYYLIVNYLDTHF